LLASRIDRLPPAHKELIQTLAVVGRVSSLGLIRQIASPADGELDEILSILQAGEFIYEQPTSVGVEFVFKHALTQEVAYNSLLIEQRKRLHERIGAALEMLFAGRLDDKANELAHHYQHSGNAPKAIEYLRCAANQARERAAYPRAVEQLETALQLVQSLPPTDRAYSELVIRLWMHTALRGTTGYAEASLARNARRARELSLQLGPDVEFEGFGGPRDQSRTATTPLSPAELTLRMLWSVTFNGGQMEEARSLLDELWEVVRHTGASTSIRYAHSASGWVYMWMGEFAAARQHFEQTTFGRPWSDQVKEIGVEAFYVLGHFSHLLWLLGYPERAARLAGNAVELAPSTRQSLAIALAAESELQILSGCLREKRAARSKAQKLLTLTRDSGLAYFLGFATMLMGSVLMIEGEAEQGLPLLREALNSFRDNGEAYAQMVALFALAYGCFIARRVDEGMMVVAEALAEVEARGRRVYEAEFHRLRGEFLLLHNQSNGSAAEVCFREAIKIARRQQGKSWELRATTSLARLLRETGRHDEARALLAEIYSWFTEGFDTADLEDAKALLDGLTT
jgi:tetratricopeptide (TPR) repeat protein